MLVLKTKPCMSSLTHYWENCEWLIKTVIVHMVVEFSSGSCGKSGANTCLRGQPQCSLDTELAGLCPVQMIHNDRSDRMRKRRCTIRVSDLLAEDGKVLAYHGNDG